MIFINRLHSLRALLAAVVLAASLAPCPVWADSDLDSTDTLSLENGYQEPLTSASRIPKPLSQTAENVTVVTAKDIESINAHTLADILDTVPGIQLQHNGGPGITTYTFIQSASPFFSQVLVDGVSINNLGSNFPDISSIPAQIIDRVEVIKGSASSAWGSALGGVVNVITKSPNRDRTISGSAIASIGERTTADTRVELSGTNGKAGYYLSGGYLGSNGFQPTIDINSRQAYAKLTYDLPNNGLAWATFSYNSNGQGDLFYEAADFRERHQGTRLATSLGMRYTLAEGLELEVLGKHSYIRDDFSYFFISDGSPRWSPDLYKEQVSGASTRLLWRKNHNLLALGADYNHQEREYVGNFFRKVDRWGVYLNDTYTMGPVSVSPGVRLDHSQTNGDLHSYSLGFTWQLSDSTLLRAYTGRGYSLSIVNSNDSPVQKIWTNQVGAESTAIPYLWAKATLFRNITWGAGVDQLLALGSELELRTKPLFNTTIGVAWTYTDTHKTSDGTPIHNDAATQTVKLSVRYDDGTYRAAIIGSHINWNEPESNNAKDKGMLWDLHLGAKLYEKQDNALELFFSGHNLFNNNFYNRDIFRNPSRWFEGGMRVRF